MDADQFPPSRERSALLVSLTESVTHWINHLKVGDPRSAQKLWESYFQRLVNLAHKKLLGFPRRAADEEDVALSAFDSFCRAVKRGQFPQLQDRDDLWRVLVALTERKAIALRRRESRQKRGSGIVQDEAGLVCLATTTSEEAGLEQIASREPTPEFAAMMAEECAQLLEGLGNAELRSVALWKMEGYTTEEIAGRLGRAPRTVERKLRMIRSLWEQPSEP
jgi:DNA-directed RNA polymerase specialized sigma24 family protein